MIERLMLVFGEPETDNPVAYLKEVTNLLQSYGNDVQDEAATHVIKTHKGRQFPTPAQCVAACNHIIENRSQQAQKAPLAPQHPAWTKQAIARADSLIRCQLGTRAADEGWVLSLHDFCRTHGRLPVNNEISQCVAYARDFDRAYHEVTTDPPIKGRDGIARKLGSMAPMLLKLGNTMLKRRERCERVTDGEILP
jgi:hypothetical protein